MPSFGQQHDSGPAAKMKRQAEEMLSRLLQVTEVQVAQADAQRVSFLQAAVAQQRKVESVYRVFRCRPPNKLMVLRDVETLSGEKSLFESKSFVDALHWVNNQLDPRLHAAPHGKEGRRHHPEESPFPPPKETPPVGEEETFPSTDEP